MSSMISTRDIHAEYYGTSVLAADIDSGIIKWIKLKDLSYIGEEDEYE